MMHSRTPDRPDLNLYSRVICQGAGGVMAGVVPDRDDRFIGRVHKLLHRALNGLLISAKPAFPPASNRTPAIDVVAKGDVSLASGTKWRGDGKGKWYFLESNGVELEVAVLELLVQLRLPVVFVFEQFVEKDTVLPWLCALLKRGAALPVEDLKRAAEAKYGDGYIYCNALARHGGGEAINPCCDERGQCAHCVRRLFQASHHECPKLHGSPALSGACGSRQSNKPEAPTLNSNEDATCLTRP